MTLRGLFEIKGSTLSPSMKWSREGNRKTLFDWGDVARLHPHEAHSTLAIAMNRIGGKSNTGEGEEARLLHSTPNGDSCARPLSGAAGRWCDN
jgi:hypothetical protein